MICLRTLLRIYEKNPTQKSFKIKSFLAAQNYPHDQTNVLLGHNSIIKDWNLVKISAS
jgi:hypothetical protein